MIFDLDGTPPDVGFPETRLAEKDPNGLLAIGGDLSQERILTAYRQGIFPWYSAGQPILWWSPAPRMVLHPDEVHVSRSLRKVMRQGAFEVSINHDFEGVIRACAAPRSQQEGTWLVPEMIHAYCELHRNGYAHSLEIWQGESLVGGLYGVAIGEMFYGESMFSRKPNASKLAFAKLAEIALEHPFQLIDCQIHTDHLASLGAREIGREAFHSKIAAAVDKPGRPLGRIERTPVAHMRWAQ